MNSSIITKTYPEPPLCEKEILRYAGCKSANEETAKLLNACIEEAQGKLNYRVCSRELPLSVTGALCDFGQFSLQSEDLAKNLKGCKSVIVFSATVGIELDRLIAKYGRLAPSKALLMQAIGAERVEALCDAFCEDVKKERGVSLRPRFSPGYGDLTLEAQRDIFSVLECSKRIALFLNDSLLMSPSKSVTAFIGICDGDAEVNTDKCTYCDKKDCSFRGNL